MLEFGTCGHLLRMQQGTESAVDAKRIKRVEEISVCQYLSEVSQCIGWRHIQSSRLRHDVTPGTAAGLRSSGVTGLFTE